MSRNQNNAAGFNMVELVVTMAIVLMLLALALPGYQTVIRRADSVKCMSNLRQLHSALMLFQADHGIFPLGYWEPYGGNPKPGERISPIRRPIVWGVPQTGTYTQWQIDLAAYLGNGNVQHANWLIGPTYSGSMKASEAYNTTDGLDPSAWRLPLDFRCPGYNRKLADPAFDWEHSNGDRIHNDHYGYCYNHLVLNNNRSGITPVQAGLHQLRDPRHMVTDYAGVNDSAHTLVFFCSRWGIWQNKHAYVNADLSGIRGEGWFTQPTFKGFPYNYPRGYGSYSGVAAGIHGGRDNFMFLDGHLESLDRLKPADRRRMNKTWWRPLPRDGSFGDYYYGAGNFGVAHWFDSDGFGVSSLTTSGAWTGSPPPSGYNWNY